MFLVGQLLPKCGLIFIELRNTVQQQNVSTKKTYMYLLIVVHCRMTSYYSKNYTCFNQELLLYRNTVNSWLTGGSMHSGSRHSSFNSNLDFFPSIFCSSDLSKYIWLFSMCRSNPVTVNRPLSQHLSPAVLSSFHPPSSSFPLFIVSPLPLKTNTDCHLRTFYCLKHINLLSGRVISLSSRVTALLF